jgi:7-carboxy-7-deazaguanine synthase (Cx14CxxC type)
MTYTVKELFYTLQGEGAQTGRAAVFCRFSGCNLWSGKEKDRQTSQCPFCDTDFVGYNGQDGGKYPDADSLAQAIALAWPAVTNKGRTKKNATEEIPGRPYVVFTGGEPLLQLDKPLIDKVHELGFEIGVETNGTLKAPEGIDWICVSPKDLKKLKQRCGQEIKLLYPLLYLPPAAFAQMDFDYFYLQPLDEECSDYTQDVVQYCLAHPQWRISLQTHKLLNIP